MHNFWSGFKYFGAGALGAEAGLYLGPEVGFAVGGTLNVLADYSEGHIKGANLGQTILNSAFSFVSGGGSAYMGAEAGIVKAQQILFNRALKTATATTLTAAQSIQPLDGQVGFQQTTTDAEVPQQVAGPESNLYSTETSDARVFENPNGGTEPTLNLGTNDQIINNEGKSYNDLLKDAQEKYPNKAIKADELHHIAPKYLGGAKDGPLIPLNPAYHQVITNEFRNIYPYGLPVPGEARMLEIMKQVYSKYPLPLGY